MLHEKCSLISSNIPQWKWIKATATTKDDNINEKSNFIILNLRNIKTKTKPHPHTQFDAIKRHYHHVQYIFGESAHMMMDTKWIKRRKKKPSTHIHIQRITQIIFTHHSHAYSMTK